MVDKVEPAFVVLENVPGLKDRKKLPVALGEERPRYDLSNYDAVKKSLNQRGYAVIDNVFDAHEVGSLCIPFSHIIT